MKLNAIIFVPFSASAYVFLPGFEDILLCPPKFCKRKKRQIRRLALGMYVYLFCVGMASESKYKLHLTLDNLTVVISYFYAVENTGVVRRTILNVRMVLATQYLSIVGVSWKTQYKS